MTYHPGRAVLPMALCYPERRALDCALCVRFRPGYPIPPEQRAMVVIDASVIPRSSTGCRLFDAKPVTTPFSELEPA